MLSVVAGVPALSESAPVPEDVRGLSGAQYKDKVVSRLFRARWPGAVAVGMCQVLRDLDLGERQLSVAVSRVLRHLRKSAKLHDLPPLTYQLLLLAGRCGRAAQVVGREGRSRLVPCLPCLGPCPSSPRSVSGNSGGVCPAITLQSPLDGRFTAVRRRHQISVPGKGHSRSRVFFTFSRPLRLRVHRPTSPARSNPIQIHLHVLVVEGARRPPWRA